MRICEIHIDGFGIFGNRHIAGLTSGINVVYGSNEFGKSTLLSFIRRVLFGFPRSAANLNPYPPLKGGAYGGKVVCALTGGERITISRTEGPHGGPVTVSMASREVSGQEELSKILGHITRTFYENVYAISLEELEAIKSLQEEEVKSHIYGAGLGLGNISLASIKNDFIKEGESLFKPGGSAQKLPTLYRDIKNLEKEIQGIQRGLATYDDLSNQRDELVEKADRLDDQIRRLEEKRLSLENKKRLFSTYVDLGTAESELSELQETPGFTKDALEEFRQLRSGITGLETSIGTDKEELRDLELQRDNLAYNEEIIKQEASVISLQRRSAMYKEASEDIDNVKLERANLAGKIEKGIGQLGLGWSAGIIKNFNLSHLQRDGIRSAKASLDDAKSRVSDSNVKLDYHIEKSAGEASKGFIGPGFFRYAMYGVVALGLIGSLMGLLSPDWPLFVLSIILLGVGIIVSVKARKRDETALTDPLGKTLARNLDDAKSEYERVEGEWRELLRSISFDENLSPDGALEVVNAIQVIQSDLSSLDGLDKRIGGMQEAIDGVKELHDQVTLCVDKSKISGDIGTDIEILLRYLNTEKNTRKDKQALQEQIDKLRHKITTAQKDKEQAEKKCQDYISSLGAEGETDFKLKYDAFARRTELNKTIDDCKRIIQATIGAGEHYDLFIESISATSPEEIGLQLQDTESEKEGLEDERDQEFQRIGEARTKIEQLSSSEDLLIKQSEVEQKKQQLRDHSRDWTMSQAALFMLNRAISKYENTRQPAVIKAAEDIFSSITSNAYPCILRPLESDELQIRDDLGNSKGIIQMSRGTKEQLYFAMRLGLIKEYELRSEPMPIIMDDILVNFDDDRGPLAIKALNEFANDRQVIVFTCHRNASELYRELGANEIILT